MARERTPVLYTEDNPDEPIVLPFKFEICSTCRGHGRNSLHMGAYTASEMAEQGPDFHDDYMAGVYDRACELCDGTGKVKVADYARMTEAQIKAYNDQCEADDEMDAIQAAEIRMGC